MQYIYQVYQAGSFTKAAEKLYLTQPALSMAVRQEEKNLGAALFDRSRRPLTLTQAGEAYIRAVEQLKYLESDLSRELEDLRDLNTGIQASSSKCQRTARPGWQRGWSGVSWP